MLSQPRVLVIDDDPACLRILRKFLERDGYQVVCADDGHRALAQARSAKPDLIICDWMMPNMDGPQVCQAFKGDPTFRDTFFIFLTALGKSHIGQGISQGADDFITKPIDPLEVRAKVKAGLRLTQVQKDLLDQAYRDVLTGAFNRRHWENALTQACLGKTAFIVALADIDRFKEINDGWGHHVGDAFLRELVRSWTDKLKEGEILARLGGDEFACLYCRSLARLKHLRQEVEQDLATAFPALTVGISMGCAQFRAEGSVEADTLMARADARLYREKSQRREG